MRAYVTRTCTCFFCGLSHSRGVKVSGKKGPRSLTLPLGQDMRERSRTPDGKTRECTAVPLGVEVVLFSRGFE